MKQAIKRSDAIYTELDVMESQVKQYYALRNYLHTRKMERVFGRKFRDDKSDIDVQFEIEYKISQRVKEDIIKFIVEHCKNEDIAHEVKEQLDSDIADLMDLYSIMAYFHEDENFQELLFEHFSYKANIYITSYNFYNDPNQQVWVKLDLSISKEELLTQIGELKDAHDANSITPNGKKIILKESDEEWIGKGLNPLTFSKSIKRQFGDLLFVYDCTNAGYKRQYIINESFNHRSKINDNNTALTHDTIRKYLKKADEVMDTIIL